MPIKFTSASDFNAKTNERQISMVLGEDLSLRWKLAELLEERNMQKIELSRLTGIRASTITDYVESDKPLATVNIGHLFAIMIALRITDISEILEVSMPKETVNRFRRERRAWIERGVAPSYRLGQ